MKKLLSIFGLIACGSTVAVLASCGEETVKTMPKEAVTDPIAESAAIEYPVPATPSMEAPSMISAAAAKLLGIGEIAPALPSMSAPTIVSEEVQSRLGILK